ncbi:MAG: hypothetical protein HN348_05445 [Proteobacteria bacterium]|nr:hypothetical protein [Pseudomonadota bacterium]
MGIFTDSDFVGGGTNGKGHEFNAAFVFYKPAVLFFSQFYAKTPWDDGNDYLRTQIYLSVKL